MDSFHSSGGSMESSSGDHDDDEYGSSPAVAGAGLIALSSFSMNCNSHNHAHQQLLHHHDNNAPPPPLPTFDALPNFFDQLTQPGPPHHNYQQLFQLGAGMGGDELGVMLPPSAMSTSANLTRALQLPADLGYYPSQRQITAGSTGEVTNPSSDLVSDPPKPAECRPAGENKNNGVPPRRNPRKRTRASRRALTTVLKTDTSNFRAMVQQFTGIPAPPFDAAASLFQRGRFELFGMNLSGNTSAPGLSIPPSSPSYLLRPFAHRLLQSSPLPPTSLFIPSAASGDNTTSAATELLFPLLSDNNNNKVNGPQNASPSMLEFGQALVKYSSNHDQERVQELHRPDSPGNHGPGGINNVIEEFRITRQEGDRGGLSDRDFVASPSSTRNAAIANRSEGGMPMESWICSSD